MFPEVALRAELSVKSQTSHSMYVYMYVLNVIRFLATILICQQNKTKQSKHSHK